MKYKKAIFITLLAGSCITQIFAQDSTSGIISVKNNTSKDIKADIKLNQGGNYTGPSIQVLNIGVTGRNATLNYLMSSPQTVITQETANKSCQTTSTKNTASISVETSMGIQSGVFNTAAKQTATWSLAIDKTVETCTNISKGTQQTFQNFLDRDQAYAVSIEYIDPSNGSNLLPNTAFGLAIIPAGINSVTVAPIQPPKYLNSKIHLDLYYKGNKVADNSVVVLPLVSSTVSGNGFEDISVEINYEGNDIDFAKEVAIN